MEKNERLERIVETIIDRFDNTKIVGDSGFDHVSHVGDKDYNSPHARKRKPHEISLAKLTRKLFFVDDKTKAFREEFSLTEEEQEALVYFTRRRKELGAVWVDFLKQGLANFYFGESEYVESYPLHTETDFLDFYTLKILGGGSRIFKDHTIEVGEKSTRKKYSATELVHEWMKLKTQGQTKFDHLKRIKEIGASIPYIMHAVYKTAMRRDDNSPSMIFGRVKHSDSANIKQAEVWAEELDLCDRLRLYEEGEEKKRGYKDSQTLALNLKKDEPKSSAFVRQFKSNQANEGQEPSRLDELLSHWRYDIEDLFGLTIVLPVEYDPEFTYGLISRFKKGDSIFIYEENSDDDHTKKSDKPKEYQFKVRINKQKLYDLLPEVASEIYMPDTIEIQVISAPDLVHKQLAPYLSERYYKGRKTKERLATPQARAYYSKIFTSLRNISPVVGTIADENKHIAALRENLQNASTYAEEYYLFKSLNHFRQKLFKKFVLF